MGEHDPRRLTVILEDLQQELQRWILKASTIRESAAYAQQQAWEQVTETQRRAAITNNQRLVDQEDLELRGSELEKLLAQADEGQQMAHILLSRADEILKKAEANLALWQQELANARAWLTRAEERVRRAEAELARAEAALAVAERDLRSARAALAACLSYRDEKGRGRNCSGPAASVMAAERAVRGAESWVANARAELVDAKAERERARARVRCCERAVEYSERAVIKAEDSFSRADMAVNAAERSLESVQAARNFWQQAERQTVLQAEATEELLDMLQIAAKQVEEGDAHFRLADQTEEAAHRLGIIACQDLQARIDSLYYFNQTFSPSSGMSSSAMTGGANTVVVPTGGSRRADTLLERKIDRAEIADLSSPSEWAKFAHAAVADYILDRDATAEVEKSVTVMGEDGQIRKGRIDILTQGLIIDVKTHTLDHLSEAALIRRLNAFVTQLQGYQNSPDLPRKPDLAVFIEFRPRQAERRKQIEEFLGSREIVVIWGNE